MKKEICSNCKYAQVAWIPVGETQSGIHTSDKHIDMYLCRHRRAQHYGHIMLGDHSCLGFKELGVDRDTHRQKT
ncbi:hypothetical protein ACFLW2_02460 [Chloroflexota bacterium]